MSKNKNMLSLSVSDTENASVDSNKNKNDTEKKRVYTKKNAITDKEMEQLTFLTKLDQFEEDINNQFEIIKRLKTFAKEIRQTYQQDIMKIKRMRRHKENSSNTGFNKKMIIPDKLCELIGVDKGIELSIPEYTSKIYCELKKRNLVYENDKRIYRVDKQFIEILGIKESVNKSIKYPDENGLNIGTMQMYVNDALKKYKAQPSQKLLENEDKGEKVKIVKKINKD